VLAGYIKTGISHVNTGFHLALEINRDGVLSVLDLADNYVKPNIGMTTAIAILAPEQ
jgi:hypothetical protein